MLSVCILRAKSSLLCGVVLLFFSVSYRSASAGEPVKSIDLTKLSLEDLASRLDSAPRSRREMDNERKETYDAILCEFIRRGGDTAVQVLAGKLAEQARELAVSHTIVDAMESGENEDMPAPEREYLSVENWKSRALERNLELLTALRRIKRQPDPLAIIIDQPARLKAATRRLPTLEVSLKNVDLEKRPFGIHAGGDYRSGRHARWRIHVWDANGALLPESRNNSFLGGGIYRDLSLTFGATWGLQLPLESYVKIRAAGKYKVQILYHDSETIADISDLKALENLILFRSEPFELKVEHGAKISIRLKKGEMETAKSLTNSLNERDPLRILIGEYKKDAHDFISTKSPQGQLLAMQWQAVPALIESLNNEKLSFRKRAWILSLLFSITLERELNPMQDFEGLLPDYETRGSLVSTVQWGGGHSQQWQADGKHHAWTPDVYKQQALAKQWIRFRDESLDIQVEK